MRFQVLVVAFLSIACLASSAHAEFFWKKKKKAEKEPAVMPPIAPVPPDSKTPSTQDIPPPTRPIVAPQSDSQTPSSQVEESTVVNNKKALYRLKDDETIEALVKLATGRQLREQELVVVSRLLNEKQLELSGFNEQLKEKFGISAEGNYQYDDETRTIFALKAKPGAENASKDAKPEDLVERTVQRELENAEVEELFLKMVGAKKVTTDEIRALQMILQEKKIELTHIQESLQEQFSMAPDKHYEYDSETHVVYELILAAADEQVPAAEKK